MTQKITWRKKIGELTQEQKDAFEALDRCSRSCKLLVKEIVHEYEKVVGQTDEMWRAMSDHFGVEVHKRMTVQDGVVYVEEPAHEMFRKMEEQKSWRKIFKNMFSKKEETEGRS